MEVWHYSGDFCPLPLLLIANTIEDNQLAAH